jgi:hypothetical protein
MAEARVRCSCPSAPVGDTYHGCTCRRMSDADWHAYSDRLIAGVRGAKAIEDGTVHAEHAAVDANVRTAMDADPALTYAQALDAVLDQQPGPEPEIEVDADRQELHERVMAFMADHGATYPEALERLLENQSALTPLRLFAPGQQPRGQSPAALGPHPRR